VAQPDPGSARWQRAEYPWLIAVLRGRSRLDPFTGVGKPEPLKYHLPGAWSRRIDDEHRLVYIVTEAEIIILAARYHY
jgi:toxin YoeB